MTSNRWDAWEPELPSDGFAERTVAAALREKGKRRRMRAPIAVIAMAAAAILGGSVAWGFSAWSARRSLVSPAATEVPALRERGGAPEALPRHVFDRANAAPLPPEVAPTAHRKAAPTMSAPDGGRKAIVPRCDCADHQVICTCF